MNIKPPPPMSSIARSRFWAKVDKLEDADACWNWLGAKTKEGYGQFRVNNSNYKSHRYALSEFKGESADNRIACHTCDNPSCCNPNHLYWGTSKTNAADRGARGRRKGPSGVTHHKAKLTLDNVREIRKMFDAGATQRDIAKMYGISNSLAWSIGKRRLWKEVD